MAEIVRAQSFHLSFLLDVPKTWANLRHVSCDTYLCFMPVEYAIPHVRNLLEWQLTQPWHRRIGGGFEIYVEGVAWTGKGYDDVGLAMHWLGAIEQLLDGQTEVRTWVWDESSLILRHQDDKIGMFDERWEIFSPKTWCPVTIDFVPFIEKMLIESKDLLAWDTAMKSEIAKRHPIEEIWTAYHARLAEQRQTQTGIAPRNEIEHLGEILAHLPWELERVIQSIETKLGVWRSR